MARNTFSFQALPIINELRSQNKMPIICGGTNYYIESLLWKILIEDESKSTEVPLPIKKPKLDLSKSTYTIENNETNDNMEPKTSHKDIGECIRYAEYENMSNVKLHEELRKVDPERANELHTNERRRVLRSLEVYRKHNKPHSEILKDQKLDKRAKSRR